MIDDQLVVIDVDSDSPAARAGVRKGDVVLAIDDRQFDTAFLRAARDLPLTAADVMSSEAEPARQDEAIRFAQLRAVRRALQRMPDALPRAQTLTLQRDDGRALVVTLMPEPLIRPPAVTAYVSDAGIAVVKLNRFSVRNRADVEQALRQVADARALVLDLRGNGGGDYSQFMWLVRQFLPESRVVLTQLSRRGDEQSARELRMTSGRCAVSEADRRPDRSALGQRLGTDGNGAARAARRVDRRRVDVRLRGCGAFGICIAGSGRCARIRNRVPVGARSAHGRRAAGADDLCAADAGRPARGSRPCAGDGRKGFAGSLVAHHVCPVAVAG